jgi:hypothetical protein
MRNVARTRAVYLDLPAWGYHFFDVAPVPKRADHHEQRKPEVAGSPPIESAERAWRLS